MEECHSAVNAASTPLHAACAASEVWHTSDVSPVGAWVVLHGLARRTEWNDAVAQVLTQALGRGRRNSLFRAIEPR